MNKSIFSKSLGVIVAIVSFAINSSAQDRTITGQVEDASTSLPLAGVTISIPSGATGAVSDVNGGGLGERKKEFLSYYPLLPWI